MYTDKNRRKFLQTAIGAGITGTFSGKLESKTKPDLPYDLVAIKGGEPEDMFDKGIAAIGGMSKFAKKDQTVVVKPNSA